MTSTRWGEWHPMIVATPHGDLPTGGIFRVGDCRGQGGAEWVIELSLGGAVGEVARRPMLDGETLEEIEADVRDFLLRPDGIPPELVEAAYELEREVT